MRRSESSVAPALMPLPRATSSTFVIGAAASSGWNTAPGRSAVVIGEPNATTRPSNGALAVSSASRRARVGLVDEELDAGDEIADDEPLRVGHHEEPAVRALERRDPRPRALLRALGEAGEPAVVHASSQNARLRASNHGSSGPNAPVRFSNARRAAATRSA